MMYSSVRCVVFAIAVTAMLGSGQLPGELISFRFEGQIANVQYFDGPKQDLSVGDAFDGQFTFESTEMDWNVAPDRGTFISVLQTNAISVSVGSIQLEGKAVSMTTRPDRYSVQSYIPRIELTSDDELAQLYDRNAFQMVLTGQGLIDNADNFPLTPPSLTSVNHAFVAVDLDNSGHDGPNPYITIVGSVDSLSVVPEPIVETLFMTGILFIPFLRQRTRRFFMLHNAD